MKRLSSALKELIKKTGIEKPILQNNALLIWDDIVGETIAKNTEAEDVKHGVLFIKVSTPVWRNELMFRKKEILKKINTRLKKKIIKDIRLI